ncbi:MAG: non-hydrolyzing UDP-N-acetylglucosamine 2-epimerase [Methanomassiliicoccales archaeon]
MISIVLGTRPEIIKMSPVIRECGSRGLDYSLLHTGQHYSYRMDRLFFDELELPRPSRNLDVRSGSQGEQTGRMLMDIERVLKEDRPDMVLVQGDTNTVLAGALAASKLHVPVGHVEAGLRSFDRAMPEEVNRVLADHLSTLLFAPTEGARRNLALEGIVQGVSVTGNTVVDAVHQHSLLARKSAVLARWGLEPKNYLLATAHRQENVDHAPRLKGILEGLRRVGRETSLPVLLAAHPRTRKQISALGLSTEGVMVMDPQGYLDFLRLMDSASLILTDSGGVQEEACILGVPCVTLRDNTERPETVEVGANRLAGADPDRILEAAVGMMRGGSWENPFGDGRASERIVDLVEENG